MSQEKEKGGGLYDIAAEKAGNFFNKNAHRKAVGTVLSLLASTVYVASKIYEVCGSAVKEVLGAVVSSVSEGSKALWKEYAEPFLKVVTKPFSGFSDFCKKGAGFAFSKGKDLYGYCSSKKSVSDAHEQSDLESATKEVINTMGHKDNVPSGHPQPTFCQSISSFLFPELPSGDPQPTFYERLCQVLGYGRGGGK